MDNNTMRKIDLEELNALATVGGNDNTPEPRAVTTPLCAVIATLTVVSLVSGLLTTNPDVCA